MPMLHGECDESEWRWYLQWSALLGISSPGILANISPRHSLMAAAPAGPPPRNTRQ